MKTNAIKPHKNGVIQFTFLATLIIMAGCTHSIKIVEAELESPLQEKVYPIHAKLILNEDFCNYEFSYSIPGDTYVFPLGNAFKESAKSLTKSVFQSVSESTTTSLQPEKVFDITIIPTIRDVSFRRGMWVWSDEEADIHLEWNIYDRDNKALWIQSIMGTACMPNDRKVMQAAIDDAFQKSLAAILAAPSIQQYCKELEKR